MPLVPCKQRSEAWYEARRGKITASIAAACLRLDPHKSAAKAWREITGREEEKPSTWWMEQGIKGEPLARNAYECNTGEIVTETGFWVHENFGWLGASPDGFIGHDGMLEIKVNRILPSRVPISHRIQCIIGMLCSGRKWCDYLAWSPSEGHFMERVYPAGGSGLLLKLMNFYHLYVKTGLEPGRKPPKKRRKRLTTGE